jgi:hypothetical protein
LFSKLRQERGHTQREAGLFALAVAAFCWLFSADPSLMRFTSASSFLFILVSFSFVIHPVYSVPGSPVPTSPRQLHGSLRSATQPGMYSTIPPLCFCTRAAVRR